MANGHHPGPVGTLGPAFPVDDDTLARISSPPPAPIGMKGGSAKGAPAGIADQVIAYARNRLGQSVGDGECYTLVNNALQNAGARSAPDYGAITPDADYVWGAVVSLSDLRPGDIIQFRDYRYDRTVETTHPDGSSETETDTQEREHHTAIVERVDGNGAATVLEQNAPDGAPVTRRQLFFSNRTETDGGRTTTIQVQGQLWYYRPQPR
jgi:hypothetical protein